MLMVGMIPTFGLGGPSAATDLHQTVLARRWSNTLQVPKSEAPRSNWPRVGPQDGPPVVAGGDGVGGLWACRKPGSRPSWMGVGLARLFENSASLVSVSAGGRLGAASNHTSLESRARTPAKTSRPGSPLVAVPWAPRMRRYPLPHGRGSLGSADASLSAPSRSRFVGLRWRVAIRSLTVAVPWAPLAQCRWPEACLAGGG